jgi:hypothetical protein
MENTSSSYLTPTSLASISCTSGAPGTLNLLNDYDLLHEDYPSTFNSQWRWLEQWGSLQRQANMGEDNLASRRMQFPPVRNSLGSNV